MLDPNDFPPSKHLPNAMLRGKDFTEYDFSGALLSGADLVAARLVRADLSKAILTHAIFHQADLTGANLRGADIRYAEFVQANLEGTDFNEAQTEGIKLTGARNVPEILRPLWEQQNVAATEEAPDKESGGFITRFLKKHNVIRHDR